MSGSDLGSFCSCFLLAAGMLALPGIELGTPAGLFATSWTVMGMLVAAAFLKDFFKNR